MLPHKFLEPDFWPFSQKTKLLDFGLHNDVRIYVVFIKKHLQFGEIFEKLGRLAERFHYNFQNLILQVRISGNIENH